MQSTPSDNSRNVIVGARGQTQVTLGKFTSTYNLRGFSVSLKPDSLKKGDVLTHVIRIDGPNDYKLYMDVINYSNETVRLAIDEF